VSRHVWRRRGFRLLELAMGLALAAAWAVTLRPTTLGGPATYIVVRGDSKLPTYHSGDLVVLRAAAAYGPGDVVGYRVPDGEIGAGHVVLHRIVDGGGAAGFTVEGDNNPAPDPWRPHDADVAGKLWVLVPGLGRLITLAHQPVVAGALATSLVVMLLLARTPRYRVRPGWIAFSAAGRPNLTA
jgi:signal peptidase I